ncbi:MAG: HNH endonuclease signature motif containing protein [Gammaproteobacteria bacterium]|nr:HNH endonuclease signature motif containing protein [Gammaproteobacteria bacterium]
MPVKPATHRPHAHTTKRHQAPEQQRSTSAQRGYGYKWQKARKGFLAKHPLCVHCQLQDKVTAATDVDHIIPHRGDMVLFWDRDNWQGLCHACHSTKTASEDGGFGNQRPRGSE